MDKSKWEYKKLEVDNLPIGDVFDIFMGRTPSRDDLSFWEDGNHEWVSIGDMGTTKYISDTKEKVSDKACSNMRLVPKDTVIMSFKLSIGKVAITEIPLYTNEAIMAFPPKSGYNISPNYLYYHLQAYKWQSANRAVMGKTLNKAVISSSRITIPDSEMQQRIVAELDCLNEMIALMQAQLKEFDKLAQSIFYDMFGDGNWKSRKIKDIAKVKIGPFGSSLHQYDYITGGTPLVNPIHMINGKIVVDNNFTITEEKKTELTSYLLKTNDIVFGRRGDIGRCALVTDKENGYLCGTGSMFVRFDIDIDPTYALCELSSKEIKKYLLDNAKGATMLNINGGIVENIPIPLPPLALQQQFAEKIQAIEAQKELVKQSIAETQQLLASRMDYYFD